MNIATKATWSSSLIYNLRPIVMLRLIFCLDQLEPQSSFFSSVVSSCTPSAMLFGSQNHLLNRDFIHSLPTRIIDSLAMNQKLSFVQARSASIGDLLYEMRVAWKRMCPIHGFDDCDLGKRDGNTTQEPMALVEEGEYKRHRQ